MQTDADTDIPPESLYGDPPLSEADQRQITAASDEYDFEANCEEIAKKRGQIVVFPKPNQIQLDIDTEEQ